MRENKTMKKFVCGLMAAVMLACAMPTSAFGAETSKKYTIDLESISDKEWNNSAVNIQMYVNGKGSYIRSDGITCTDRGEGYQQYREEDLGLPVLFRYDPNGKLDQDSMNITFIPLRKIAQVLGCPISWNDETKNVVLDTPKGRIEFPIGCTSVTAPDGTVYEEQTYRFPNGDPINIVAMRDNRTYVTVRFISSFMMPDATYKWKGTERLTVSGTIDGKGVEKTYGINENYATGDEIISLEALPHLAEALEGTNSKIKGTNILNLTSTGDVTGTENHLYVNAQTKAGIVVLGFDGLGDQTQLKVLDAMLTDLVCDADRASIMAVLQDVNANLSEDWTRKGLTPKAQTWLDNFTKSYSYSEVKLEFQMDEYGALSQFTIRTK